ncbi:hypothetical protein JCM3770_006245 [Rhodotorula araucariae]
MSQHTTPELDAMAEAAFKTRLEGNELFKAGNLPGALLKYHQVLLVLKGINYPMRPAEPVVAPRSGVEEVTDAEPAEIEAEERTSKPLVAGESMADKVTNALMNTYLNSAAIYVKQERWQRALESAKSAQKYNKENPKGKFREAQALIGLGKVYEGRRMLEELVKSNPDPAVAAALNKLAADDRVREAKKNEQFKGMFDRSRKSGSQNDKGPTERAVDDAAKKGTNGTAGADGKADTAAEMEVDKPTEALAQAGQVAPAQTSPAKECAVHVEDSAPVQDEPTRTTLSQA